MRISDWSSDVCSSDLSGKSTFFKQMKIIHLQGFSDEEKKAVRSVIFLNLIHYMQILLKQCDLFGFQINEANANHKELIQAIPDEQLQAQTVEIGRESCREGVGT